MDSRRVDDYLSRLKRRESFLESRIVGREVEQSHYDRSELMALQWSIRYIEDTIIEAAEHQSKYFKEMSERL